MSKRAKRKGAAIKPGKPTPGGKLARMINNNIAKRVDAEDRKKQAAMRKAIGERVGNGEESRTEYKRKRLERKKAKKRARRAEKRAA